MAKYQVTWSQIENCSTEIEADSPQEAIDLVKTGYYHFIEAFGVEQITGSHEAEEA